MNGQLEDLLRRRADRADPDPDADRMLRQVRALAEQQRRRRRGLAAAGSGVVVVVAVVTLILVVTPGGSGSPNGRQVGERPASNSAANIRPAPAPKTLPVTAATSASAPAVQGRLVKAGVTPKRAPLAVRLVPAGYHFLGAAPDATIYGPTGTNRNPNVWAGKLALILGDSNGQRLSGPLKIAGYPARIAADTLLGWNITIRYSKSVFISIYVPTKAHLSRAQAIQLANTLKMRDTSNVAHG